jgi:hypothetical protein
MSNINALKSRRSEYVLSKNVQMNDAAIEGMVKDVLTYTPSAFNAQSQRILLLLGDEHDTLWDQLIEIMKGIVEGDQFEKTKDKINGFKNAYGTVLFYEDMSVIEDLQSRFPLYKDNFSKWSLEQNGMLQSNVWVELRANGLGASLQHYNELIDEYLKKTYDLPKKWALRAQMPFGEITIQSDDKPKMDINKRFILKK